MKPAILISNQLITQKVIRVFANGQRILMEKVGCNHLVIAGLLESRSYAMADFLSMHLEQHLQFTIDRQGRLKSQWDDYYENVLVPLEITSDAIKNGETVVYTREGRLIGGFDEFKDWAMKKYNVEIEYPDDRMEAITKVHVKRAEDAIADEKQAAFDEKVDKLLGEREKVMRKARKELDAHKAIRAMATSAISELEELISTMQPAVDALYELHHYPVPEEKPEEEEDKSEEQKVPEEEEEEKKEKQEGEEEEEKHETEEEDGEKKQESEETQRTEPAEETHESEETNETEPTAANPEEEEEKQEVNHEEEEEKTEKPPEEEEEPEPDAEALDAQAKIQETLKWPKLEKCQAAVEKMATADLSLGEFVQDLEAKMAQCTEMIASEKFRWKKVEAEMLDLKERIRVMINMFIISIISVEDLQIKAVEEEIENYDNFIIPDADEEVLQAAAIKYAATFQFA